MLCLNGAGIGVAGVGASLRGGVTAGAVLVCLALGACLWTAVEYVVHRWLLHGVMSGTHARPHAEPLNPRYLHGPLSAGALTYAASLGGLTLSLGLARGLRAFVGLNAADVAFELPHAGVHADFGAVWFSSARSLRAPCRSSGAPRSR